MDGKTRIKTARSLVRLAAELADTGVDVFAEYKSFYEDGKWVVEVVRKLNGVLEKLTVKKYTAALPKINECLNYMHDAPASVADTLGTAKAFQEYTGMMDRIRKAYDMTMDGDVDDLKGRGGKAMSFTDAVKDMLEYSQSYEKSCLNAFRNRYIDDEAVVRDLLDTINDCANDVLNGHAG